MEFGLLGPLTANLLGALLPVPQGKQRAILAVLLLRSGQVVPVDYLMDVIWDGRPPRAARPTLHNHVKRLRQSLGDEGYARIRTSGSGYAIQTSPEELDLTRFAALCAAGRVAAAAGDWRGSAAQLTAALSLWRGQPLADIQCPQLTVTEVPPLLERRLTALEDRIDAELHLGNHRQVIAELRQLVSAEPLREGFCSRLMLALYRAGRQAEALAAYQETRRALIRELGVEPGPDLRRTQHRILAGDPALYPANW